MKLPAFLPDHLKHYGKNNSDEELFRSLFENPVELITFFTTACADETWSEEHSEFMHSAILLWTEQSLDQKLSDNSLKYITEAIHAHYANLRDLIPSNLMIKSSLNSVNANSLLIAACSDILKELIGYRKIENNQPYIIVESEIQGFLELVVEVAHTNLARDLWKYSEEDLFEILRESDKIHMRRLADLTQETLKRYVNPSNVYNRLETAQNASWDILELHCLNIINSHGGVRTFQVVELEQWLPKTSIKPLGIEFYDFSTPSLDIFDTLQTKITHLVCSGSLIEEAAFSEILKTAPNLRSIDVSHSKSFSEALLELPSTATELDLSKCSWLTEELLKKVIGRNPQIERLSLNSNIHLTYSAWGDLQKLSHLRALDLTRCVQMHDNEFHMILKACPRLTHLMLESCTGLSGKAFFDLAHTLRNLIELNLSRCAIVDGVLHEIGISCRSLRVLNLAGCKAITENGLYQLLQQAINLKKLNIENCFISEAARQRLQQARPNLLLN